MCDIDPDLMPFSLVCDPECPDWVEFKYIYSTEYIRMKKKHAELIFGEIVIGNPQGTEPEFLYLDLI